MTILYFLLSDFLLQAVQQMLSLLFSHMSQYAEKGALCITKTITYLLFIIVHLRKKFNMKMA